MAVALLIGAWFVLGWIQARDTGRADALLSDTTSPSTAQGIQLRSLLNTAGALNPDRAVDLLRARLAQDQHHHAQAIRILEQVTRSEPQNVLAWSQLGFTAGAAGQIRLAKEAGGHVARLVPPIR